VAGDGLADAAVCDAVMKTADGAAKACTYSAAAPAGADFYTPVGVPAGTRMVPAHCSWVGAEAAAADPTATTCDQPAQVEMGDNR
jgi:hypothetical protein